MKTNLGTHRFIDSKLETFLGFLTENQLLILTREAFATCCNLCLELCVIPTSLYA